MDNETLLHNVQRALANRDRQYVFNTIHKFVQQQANLGKNWLKVGQLALAIGELNLAIKSAELFAQSTTDDVSNVIQQAGLYAEAGELQQALKQVDKLIKQQISSPAIYHMSGTIRAQLGKLELAQVHLQKALDLSPYLGITWYTLATIVDFSMAQQLFEKLLSNRKSLQLNDEVNCMYYQYAIGKAYADKKMFAQAERAYFEGAKVMLKQSRYNKEHDKRLVNTIALNFTKKIPQYVISNDNSLRPIFAILGLPRSGSTLLAQMLGCHSEIAGAKELNAFGPATMHLSSTEYLNFSQYLENQENAEEEIKKIADVYRHIINQHFPDSGSVVDKSMNLNRYFGIWAQVIPTGKAIYISRDDNDTAWSCYRTPFRERAEWSWHPKTIAAYISNERKLLAHWRAQFKDRILEVKYEDLVKDTEITLKKICSFLSIEFEKKMLEFYTSKSPVLTSSVGQVHKPMNKLGLDVSKHYPGFISALRD